MSWSASTAGRRRCRGEYAGFCPDPGGAKPCHERRSRTWRILMQVSSGRYHNDCASNLKPSPCGEGTPQGRMRGVLIPALRKSASGTPSSIHSATNSLYKQFLSAYLPMTVHRTVPVKTLDLQVFAPVGMLGSFPRKRGSLRFRTRQEPSPLVERRASPLLGGSR